MTQKKIENALRNGTDDYYLSVMSSLSSGKKFRWNWGAFVGGPLWLAYRKMYLYSSICLTLIIPSLIMITASSNNAGLSTKLEQDVIHAMSAASITLVLFLQLLFSIFLGFFGNNLYYRHIRKKIRKGYHFCKEYESTDVLMVYFFMFFFVLMPNAYLKDKARVKKSLNGMDDFDTSFDDKNIESVTSVSSH
jgi:hypothetical protein